MSIHLQMGLHNNGIPFCDVCFAEPGHAVCARVVVVGGGSLGKIARQQILPNFPRPISGGSFPVGPPPHGTLKTVDHACADLSMPSQLPPEHDQVTADAEASPPSLDAPHELRFSLEYSGGWAWACSHVPVLFFSAQAERRFRGAYHQLLPLESILDGTSSFGPHLVQNPGNLYF